MPYSDRQLHCLSAMGLVAWESRKTGQAESVGQPDPVTTSTPASAPDPSPSPESMVVSAPSSPPTTRPTLALPIPRDPEALGGWLPGARLATFTHRDQSLTRVGRADAPLFVVVERTPGEPARLPLQGLADTLFENMLRSIGMARHHTCQCVLDNEPLANGDTVASLADREHRASLVLLQTFDESLTPDACRLPDSATGRAGWCLPHPALLLAEPHRKRQAWRVLQALQRHLAAPGAA